MKENQNDIGTRLVLNFPKLESVILGTNVGTKLILGLPPLEPIFISTNANSEQKGIAIVRKK